MVVFFNTVHLICKDFIVHLFIKELNFVLVHTIYSYDSLNIGMIRPHYYFPQPARVFRYQNRLQNLTREIGQKYKVKLVFFKNQAYNKT